MELVFKNQDTGSAFKRMEIFAKFGGTTSAGLSICQAEFEDKDLLKIQRPDNDARWECKIRSKLTAKRSSYFE